MQSYRINAVHELRAAHIAALEEIAKEKPIYFSGVDEEFVRNQALLSDAKRNYKGAISVLFTLARSIKDASILFVLDDAEKIGRECTHLEKAHAKLVGRQERIARTAKRIEDILTDFGFKKQTVTPPKEGSIDYVIYTCRRDDHVDVLADRGLGTKKRGVRLYRIPENEFAEWYGALQTGGKLSLDARAKHSSFSGWVTASAGALFCGVVGLGMNIYSTSIGSHNELIHLVAMGVSVLGPVSIMLGHHHFSISQASYFDRHLVAKGKEALLYPTRQEEVMPQCRVVVEQEDAANHGVIEREVRAGIKAEESISDPALRYQHKPLI